MKTTKNTIVAVCTILAILLVVIGMTLYFIHDHNEEVRLRHFYENADTTGTVVAKHTHEPTTHSHSGVGTYFIITVEYDSTTLSGEKTTFTQEYHITWEDFAQIEVGDAVISKYTAAPAIVNGWEYITFEKRARASE